MGDLILIFLPPSLPPSLLPSFPPFFLMAGMHGGGREIMSDNECNSGKKKTDLRMSHNTWGRPEKDHLTAEVKKGLQVSARSGPPITLSAKLLYEATKWGAGRMRMGTHNMGREAHKGL
jgi:hypothetical protein